MSYTICKSCGGMFESNRKIYCEKCDKLMENDISQIMDYIKLNPGASVLDIITNTGVSLKSINLLVEDGHVSYVQNNKNIDFNEFYEKNKSIIVNEGKFYSRRLRD